MEPFAQFIENYRQTNRNLVKDGKNIHRDMEELRESMLKSQ
jgi:hypothetical protein